MDNAGIFNKIKDLFALGWDSRILWLVFKFVTQFMRFLICWLEDGDLNIKYNICYKFWSIL